MRLRRTFIGAMTATITLLSSMPIMAQTNQPIPVVATFSILGDIVENIGGEHINVTTLVGPDGDNHVFQPTPADARAVSEAKILIVNGLEFEGWLDRLIEASDFNGELVVATRGIEAIPYEEGTDHHDDHHDDEAHHENEDHHDKEIHHDDGHAENGHEGHHHHGAFDPHAWQSLTHAVTYIDNITAALAQADPAHAADYYQNRAVYITELNALNAEIKQMLASLPKNRRTVVTSHDAFQYFGHEYGLTFLAPQGLSTESEASAKNIAGLIEHMREQQISAVFIENITDPRLLKQIANETGATIGGTLYPGALSSADGPAATYLEMMRHNATTLVEALNNQ